MINSIRFLTFSLISISILIDHVVAQVPGAINLAPPQPTCGKQGEYSINSSQCNKAIDNISQPANSDPNSSERTIIFAPPSDASVCGSCKVTFQMVDESSTVAVDYSSLTVNPTEAKTAAAHIFSSCAGYGTMRLPPSLTLSQSPPINLIIEYGSNVYCQ